MKIGIAYIATELIHYEMKLVKEGNAADEDWKRSRKESKNSQAVIEEDLIAIEKK